MKCFLLAANVMWLLVLIGFGQFRAGASAVDVTPTAFPVIQNGGFLEGQIHLATEKLHARCLTLDDGKTRLAMVIVDSCMIPRTLCDDAKRLAAEKTGLNPGKILIAATHTHSAPSVMDFCLGSRADPGYSVFLVEKIVQAIAEAVRRLEPAKAAWASVDAGDFTNCRRWITRADAMQIDPFGAATVRAMMHPGYQNPKFVGPAGPKDPWLTFLSVQTASGKPLALLGNYSMHYFGGHPGASPDYCGHFADQVEQRLASGEDAFVGLLSQGTSGDLWWADYGKAKVTREIESYTKELVDLVVEAHTNLEHRADVGLAMAEKRMSFRRRIPDEARLAWARDLMKGMVGRRPKNRPEVYAEQAIYIHEHPEEEVVLQAIRVGALGMVAMPNEVYALTGLKVKAQSPLPMTCTLELANGAAGYIPPPEQHTFGGYTTWPARTAGLAVDAEPVIVDSVLALLEEVSGKKRRKYEEQSNAYSEAVLRTQPDIYWRLGEQGGEIAYDSSGNGRHGTYIGRLAYHLPGIPGARNASHAVHFAGGMVNRITEDTPVGNYSIVFWLWNGVTTEAKLTQIGETFGFSNKGQLLVQYQDKLLQGTVTLAEKQWCHIALVRDGELVTVFVNGEQDLCGVLPETLQRKPVVIGSNELQGKLDEVAIYHRSLKLEEIANLTVIRD
jgi:hypothetical protein